MQLPPEPRECPLCRFRRIPYARKVTKNRKSWIIYQCPMCKHRDIDEYKPTKLFNDRTRKWEDEVIPNEDQPE